ncbi:MAG: hypothetical protein MK133_15220, partial [Planctomycetes bacterium]|nr:hypothetical protein [Planctomycetota bacterium]
MTRKLPGGNISLKDYAPSALALRQTDSIPPWRSPGMYGRTFYWLPLLLTATLTPAPALPSDPI